MKPRRIWLTAQLSILFLMTAVALRSKPPASRRFPEFTPITKASRGEKPQLAYDKFGGLLAWKDRPTGFFRLVKVGPRWIFITPEGHPFWMKAVYGVDWSDGGGVAQEAIRAKYGGDGFAFAKHAVERLKAWGFNTLGEYSSVYSYPVPTYFRPRGNPAKMPFIRLLDISAGGALDRGGLAPAPFKTLLAGAVDRSVYKGWPGNVPDVFDPNFELYARNLAADLKTTRYDTVFTGDSARGGLPQPSLARTAWLIGTTPDDTDSLFGFGPGPEIPGSDGVIHPNIGWIVAVTKPFQNKNTQVGAALGDRTTVTYSDPVVYTKRAWRDYLKKKYRTIQALNAAWKSHYTTFDSDGGWPDGRGLMDESGRNPWIGNDAYRLSTATPGARADLNAFLGIYADRYFSVVAAAIRAATPRQLVFSPAPLDSHEGMTRPEILKAAGRYCDAIQIDAGVQRPDIIARTYDETHKPMFSWVGFEANPDSALRGHRQGWLGSETQGSRGTRYANEVSLLLAYTSSAGIYPMVGLDWWEYMDKVAEEANWGLVTPLDNAYDGKEGVIARGKDSWGYPTGGESGNFGDFLSAVEQANFGADEQLLRELTQRAGVSSPRSRVATVR